MLSCAGMRRWTKGRETRRQSDVSTKQINCARARVLFVCAHAVGVALPFPIFHQGVLRRVSSRLLKSKAPGGPGRLFPPGSVENRVAPNPPLKEAHTHPNLHTHIKVHLEKGDRGPRERCCRVAGFLCVTGCFLAETGLSTRNQRLWPRSHTVFRHWLHLLSRARTRPDCSMRGMAGQSGMSPSPRPARFVKKPGPAIAPRLGSSGSPVVS